MAPSTLFACINSDAGGYILVLQLAAACKWLLVGSLCLTLAVKNARYDLTLSSKQIFLDSLSAACMSTALFAWSTTADKPEGKVSNAPR